MNREAVVLGTKVISIFREELLTIDKWLIKNKFMLHNPNPTKEFIDDVINFRIKINKYQSSNEAFKFFWNLIKNQKIH